MTQKNNENFYHETFLLNPIETNDQSIQSNRKTIPIKIMKYFLLSTIETNDFLQY